MTTIHNLDEAKNFAKDVSQGSSGIWPVFKDGNGYHITNDYRRISPHWEVVAEFQNGELLEDAVPVS